MAIQTLSGPQKIRDLSDRTVLNSEFSVLALAWVSGGLTIEPVSDFRVLGQQQVFEVKLDDGGLVQASPSTLFVTLGGERKMAPELQPGDRLLPLYLEEDAHGYPTFRVPGRVVKRKIARFVAEWKLGRKLPKGTNVLHIDKDRKNYHPDNLEIKLDGRGPKKGHKNPLITAYNDAKELLNEFAAVSPLISQIVEKKTKRNHKVVAVTPGKLSEVYCASVRSMGSLCASGVFLTLPS